MGQVSLTTLHEGYRAQVFGAGGGIGGALVQALAADPRCDIVFAAARSEIPGGSKIVPQRFSLEDEDSIARVVAEAAADGPLDLVIVATGLLHAGELQPEKSWRAIDARAMERAFRVNAIGPALIARHALEHLPRDRKAVFAALSARVGSIADNRLGGWHSYRASKAALNMLVRSFAMELARRNPHAACVALHPGTVSTGLSRPFTASTAAGKLFSPEHSAAYLLSVINGLTAGDSGRLIAWNGSPIPY